MQKTEIAREILAYLVDHPDAQDTMDGIVDWWLLERQILIQWRMVNDALKGLVEKGLVLKFPSADSKFHFRVNQTRYEEILLLIGKGRTT